MMNTGALDLSGTDGPVPVGILEKRELRLLRLIVEGKSPKQIAALLFISAGAVRVRIAELGREIGSAHVPPRPPFSQPELQRWALETKDSLKPGAAVVLLNHPDNCPCASAYCRATFAGKQ